MKRLLFSLALMNATAFSLPHTWTNGNSTNVWSDAANWVNGIPNSNTALVFFGQPINGPNLVNIDSSFIVNTISFSPGATPNYLLTGGTLNLQSNLTTNPAIFVEQGVQTFDTTIQLQANAGLELDTNTTFVNSRNVFGGSNVFDIFGLGTVRNFGVMSTFATVSIETIFINDGSLGQGILGNIGTLNLDGPEFFNQSGGVVSNILHANVNSGVLVNDHATFDGITNLNIAAFVINSNGGFFKNLGTVTIDGEGHVENSATIEAGNTLTLNSGVINNNLTGVINKFNQITINGGQFNNFGTLSSDIKNITLNDGLLNNQSSISVVNDFAMNGGTYEILVRNATNRTTLQANTIELNGNLLVDLANDFDMTGQQIFFMHANNLVSGTFATTETNIPLVNVEVVYDPNDVSLFLVPFIPELSPDIHLPIFSAIDMVNYRIEREMLKVRNRLCCDCSWNLYGGFMGSLGKVESRNFLPGLEYDALGGLIGIDYAACQFGWGALINYERIKSEGDRAGWHQKVDHVRGALYATYVPFNMLSLALEGIVGYGHDWFKTTRGIAGTQAVAQGSPDASEWDLLFGAEYATHVCNTMVVPYGTIQYIDFRLHKFTEATAPFFNLTFGKRHIESLRSVLGFRFLGNYCLNADTRLIPELDIGWMREHLNNDLFFTVGPAIAPQFSQSFAVAEIRKDFLVLALDLFFDFDNTFGLDLSYDLEWNQQFRNNTFYAGGSIRF